VSLLAASACYILFAIPSIGDAKNTPITTTHWSKEVLKRFIEDQIHLIALPIVMP
jgi:hypothetical protein